MNEDKIGSKNTTDQELFITRVFNAPGKHVWKAWTDPDLMKTWWGPKGLHHHTAK